MKVARLVSVVYLPNVIYALHYFINLEKIYACKIVLKTIILKKENVAVVGKIAEFVKILKSA